MVPAQLHKLLSGKNIAIVDDVINARSAVRSTLMEVEAYGARVVVIGALLVLGDTSLNLFTEKNLPLQTISYLPNKLWLPKECPLCASQVPLSEL